MSEEASAKNYNRESWIDPRIELRSSEIEGKGIFALESINEGDVMIVWGGVVLTKADIEEGLAKSRSIAPIDEGIYLGGLLDDPDSPDDFMNHSCDPNAWMQDEATIVARRDIAAGEELTADYALWETGPDWVLEPCKCKADLCRNTVTGNDWKSPKLQERYKGRFLPFINRRIESLSSG